jgi:hypothetical protein
MSSPPGSDQPLQLIGFDPDDFFDPFIPAVHLVSKTTSHLLLKVQLYKINK